MVTWQAVSALSGKARLLFSAIVVALLSDQITKALVVAHIDPWRPIPIIEGFFTLTHVRNPGAAFGLLRDLPDSIRTPFFLSVSCIAILFAFSFYRKLGPGERLAALAVGMILGGAIGNTIDRIRFGEVVDFLQFRLWGGFVWPDFNLADSWIVGGVGLLLIDLLAADGQLRPDVTNDSPTGG